MKVLFLNYEYPPLGGGAANATAYILREFSKLPDLEVDLVTSSASVKYELERIGNNIKIHKLPIGKNEKNLHFQSQKDLLVYAWKAYFFGKKLISANKYDLTHSFFTVPCGFLSMVYHRLYKLPYIVSLRGSDVPGYSDRFSFLYKFLTPLIRHIWKKSSAVIPNSEGLKKLALKTNPKQKMHIIYNGIDIEQFKPSYRSRTSVVKIICVSRLTARKGINYLIDAVKILSQKYPNLRLEIAGEGDQQAALRAQAETANLGPKIAFLGRVPHEKIAEIYNSAEVFVLPSLNEGMSNTMLEALASGLPLIATDTGGSKELILNGENGFIIKMRNSEDIAEKLEKLISDPELARKMGDESRKIAETMSWKKVAEQYFDLYKKVKYETK